MLCYILFDKNKWYIYVYYTMYINSIYVHIWYIVYICLSYFPKRCAVQIWTTRQQQKALSWLFASLLGTKTSTIYLYFVYQILFSLLICKYKYIYIHHVLHTEYYISYIYIYHIPMKNKPYYKKPWNINMYDMLWILYCILNSLNQMTKTSTLWKTELYRLRFLKT